MRLLRIFLSYAQLLACYYYRFLVYLKRVVIRVRERYSSGDLLLCCVADLSLLATRDALLGRLTKEHSDKPQGQQSSEMQSSVSSQVSCVFFFLATSSSVLANGPSRSCSLTLCR